jgi:broad specificity phosphatase PhoE
MKQPLSRSISVVGIIASLMICGAMAPNGAWAQSIGDHPEAPTTVIILRHADKAGDSGNVDLSSAGLERARILAHVCGSSGLAGLYGITDPNNDRRVRQTLQPIADLLDLSPIIFLEANSIAKLAQEIRTKYVGKKVLVVSHSGTVDEIIRTLGGDKTRCPIDWYDNLCVVTLSAAGNVDVLRLKYGAEKGAGYIGMCDASAAVAIGPKMFVVANDEDNFLRVYRSGQTGQPVATIDLNSFLKLNPDQAETDIEGATRVGDRVYWITSHGNKKDGKSDQNRRRLFATDVKVIGDQVTITPVGKPYEDLLTDLTEAPALQDLKLREAAAPPKPPEEQGGLNIEGLCATPMGTLLIAFRNPIPGGQALIVPLENPEEVVQGKMAKLGAPVLIPLGGLGIRSIEYCEALSTYLIVAGPYGDEGSFKLYKWSGVASEEPRIAQDINFQNLRPEALVVYPAKKTIQILSDDGDNPVDGKKCKKVAPDKRSFRSVWVSLTEQ